MNRMKTFGKYLVIFILFYLFVDLMSYMWLKNTYKDIECTLIEDAPKIDIIDAKSTLVNGYIIGTVKNTTGKRIEQIFMQIDLYSKRDVLLGSKYVKIDYFNTNQLKEFKANFRNEGVSYCKISFTYEDVTEKMEQENEEMKQQIMYWIPFITVVKLMCIV